MNKNIILLLSLLMVMTFFNFCNNPIDYYWHTIEVEYYDHVKDTIKVRTHMNSDPFMKFDHGTSYLKLEGHIVAYKILNFRLLKKEITYKNEENKIEHYTDK